MNCYKEVYKNLGFSDLLIEFISNNSERWFIPPFDFPFYEGFGFPPSFIPLGHLSSDFGYLFFNYSPNSSQMGSFCVYTISSKRFREVAMNESQLYYFLVYESLQYAVDEEDDEEIEKVACFFNLDKNILSRNHSVIEYADFKSNLPMEFLSDNMEYHGKLHNDYVSRLNGFEYLVLSEKKRDLNDLESWHEETSLKKDLFYSYFEKGEFYKAWLCLNSPGWSLIEAKNAVTLLLSVNLGEIFCSVCDSWLKIKHPPEGY